MSPGEAGAARPGPARPVPFRREGKQGPGPGCPVCTGRSLGRSGPGRLRGGACGPAVPEPAERVPCRGRARRLLLPVVLQRGGEALHGPGRLDCAWRGDPAGDVVEGWFCEASRRASPVILMINSSRRGEPLGGFRVVGYDDSRLRHSGGSWGRSGDFIHLSREEAAQSPAWGILTAARFWHWLQLPHLHPWARFQLTVADLTSCP